VARLFLPQKTLEEWALAERADVKDDRLVVAKESGTYPVVPGVHFIKLVSGPDERKLVAKVKTHEQLQKLGAEHMAETVILGETAYEVEPGYIADVPIPSKATPKRDRATDTDMLAAFLLDKLSSS
jgi:hypothetical protein